MPANSYAGTTSPTMIPDPSIWARLREQAAARLAPDFADRTLRAARGPSDAVWGEWRAAGAACLRPGFAGRVLAAARSAVAMPSYASQLALSAGTVAVCLAAVVLLHQRQQAEADARNLAEWRSIVAAAQDLEPGGR